MKEPKLKPCPFCGGEAEIRHHRRHGDHYEVRCLNDDCTVYPRTSDWPTLEEAARRWNRRTPPTPSNEALTLEELRRMDGERVWVQYRDIGMYALVAYHADPDGDDGDDVYLTNNLGGRDTYEEVIGHGGVVFRRPPEGE